MGTRNDDISLKLTKMVQNGWLPDVSDFEVDSLTRASRVLFNLDATVGRTSRKKLSVLPNTVVATRPTYFERFLTDAGRCSRLEHTATSEFIDLTLVYGNYGGADAEPNSSINITASIEYPSGTYYKVHFSGEDVNRNVVLAPGTFKTSLPVGIRIPKGAKFYSNTLVTPVTAGGQYPAGGTIIDTNAGSTVERCSANSAVDYTLTTNPGTASTQYAYGPVALCGTSSKEYVPAIGLVGDSISVGTGDSIWNTRYENGFLVRALNFKFPYIHVGSNGESAGNWDEVNTTDILRHRFRGPLVGDTDYIIQEHVTNDFGNNNKTVAATQLSLISSWYQLSLRGAKVYQTTCNPRTTSTDSWATTTNQTAVNSRFGPETGAGSDRQLFNNWLRDGAPILNGIAAATGSQANGTLRAGDYDHPLSGVFDTAAAVEVYEPTSNTWVYKAGWTTDGIHPTSVGHVAMAARIDTSIFV